MSGAIRAILAGSLVAATSCLPLPHSETEVVEVAGVVRSGEDPAGALRVSVEQADSIRLARPAVCSGAFPVTTGANGVFLSPARRKWKGFLMLVGPSRTEVPMQVCAHLGGAWHPIYRARVNPERGIELVCDLGARSFINHQSGEAGLCTRAGAAGQPSG